MDAQRSLCRAFGNPSWSERFFGNNLRSAILANKKIAFGGWRDNQIKIFNQESKKIEKEYATEAQATELIALPDNKIAAGFDNGEIAIIDTRDESEDTLHTTTST